MSDTAHVEETTINPEPAEGRVSKEDLVQPSELSAEAGEISEGDGFTMPGGKANRELALEVVAGHWGRGNRRKQRLQLAGYDPVAVQKEVDKIFNRS